MVNCPKCGAQNAEDARFCSKCGASLYREQRREKQEDECFGSEERECFGIRHGGSIVGVVIGLFIVMVGLAFFFGENLMNLVVPFALVVIGLFVIIAAALALSRRRAY